MKKLGICWIYSIEWAAYISRQLLMFVSKWKNSEELQLKMERKIRWKRWVKRGEASIWPFSYLFDKAAAKSRLNFPLSPTTEHDSLFRVELIDKLFRILHDFSRIFGISHDFYGFKSVESKISACTSLAERETH